MRTSNRLDEVLGLLRCPHCRGSLARAGASVRCADGHAFDIARQGYLSLLPGDARLGTADTAEMVGARESFLQAGHFDRLGAALADWSDRALAEGPDGCVVDLGAGTGWYAERVLERLPDRAGLALDLSKHALRRAAHAHPRLAAVGCDAWGPLPLGDEVAALALSVFAPRNGTELARILRPDGTLLVVTPTAEHLGELVSALELLSVDERKPERLEGQLGPHFACLRRSELAWPLRLGHADVRNAATMGPSAFHVDPVELERRIAALPERTAVTAAVAVGLYRRR